MSLTYCEVALPVPLRSLFTYAIPDRLAGSVCAGSRVLVPFRNRAMTGVVVEVSTRRPDPERVKNVKEIVESLDPIPALPPKLLELGRWVGGYYVAPPGEVFRAMLPPQIDLRHEREFLLTDAGRARSRRTRCGGKSQRGRDRGTRPAFAHGNRRNGRSARTGCASCRAEKLPRSACCAGARSKRARSRCTGTRVCRRSSRGTRFRRDSPEAERNRR